jgi:hypothetical protein
VEPTADNVAPNWGGHRFWLGPQSRWIWPPVKEWEFSAAEAVTSEGPVLRVKHARLNPAYPRVEREYSWSEDRLKCAVRWSGGEKPFYGMHVIAIDNPAEITARPYTWDHVPHGVVGVHGDTPNTQTPLPNAAVEVAGDRLRIRNGITTAKLGFPPQVLQVTRGDWTLSVAPGEIQGTPIESPDFGYLSQVWVGPKQYTYSELEQLTPFMLPADDGWCGSTLYLQATRRKSDS